MIAPEKFYEPFHRTVIRTALFAGILSLFFYWNQLADEQGKEMLRIFGNGWMSCFWFTFGGYWIEILYINYLKFYLPRNLPLLYACRIVVWYGTAIVFLYLSESSYNFLMKQENSITISWTFGFIYIGIEMLIHGFIHYRIKKSFWNGVY